MTATHVSQDHVLNGVVLDLQHRLREAQDELQRQDETIAALRAFILDQGQLAEEAGLVLRGVYRNARAAASNPLGDPDPDDVQAGGRREPTWPNT
jgi:hypothetical protein